MVHTDQEDLDRDDYLLPEFAGEAHEQAHVHAGLDWVHSIDHEFE